VLDYRHDDGNEARGLSTDGSGVLHVLETMSGDRFVEGAA